MRILAVSGSRADWGHLESVIVEAHRRGHSVVLWLTGENRGAFVVPSYIPGAVLKIAPELFDADIREIDVVGPFDVALIPGDRPEQLDAAAFCTEHRIPIAHIQAGDVSGHRDHRIRFAIGALAHVHCCATSWNARRLLMAGEEPSRVIETGAPQLDGIAEIAAQHTREEVIATLNARSGGTGERALAGKPYAILLQHPCDDEESAAFIHPAAAHLSGLGLGIVGVRPNSDPGHHSVSLALLACGIGYDIPLFENLPRPLFLAALARAAVIVGNSSCGITEAPVLGTPTVNCGQRQRGRTPYGKWVFDAATPGDLPNAIDAALMVARHPLDARLAGMTVSPKPAAPRVLDAIEAAMARPRAEFLNKRWTHD